MFCPHCEEDVGTRVEMVPGGGTMQRCAKAGHALETAPELRQVAGPASNGFTDAEGVPVLFGLPGAQPQPTHVQVRTVAKAITGAAGVNVSMNLPAMIRARKKELKARIRADQRELAELERLTTPRRRAPATVTHIKRGAS